MKTHPQYYLNLIKSLYIYYIPYAIFLILRLLLEFMVNTPRNFICIFEAFKQYSSLLHLNLIMFIQDIIIDFIQLMRSTI